MIFILGYILLASSWLLVTSMVLDRYWGTSLLRGTVTPAEKLIFEGRSWWIRDPFRYLIVGIPLPIVLFVYIILIIPNPHPLLCGTLHLIWIPSVLMFIVAAVDHSLRDEENRTGE